MEAERSRWDPNSGCMAYDFTLEVTVCVRVRQRPTWLYTAQNWTMGTDETALFLSADDRRECIQLLSGCTVLIQKLVQISQIIDFELRRVSATASLND